MNMYQAPQDDESEMMDPEEYHRYKAVCEQVIADSECAIRLAENPDFQKVIMEGYLKNEPVRIAELMASGRLNAAQFADCGEDLKGIGNLRMYLQQAASKAEIARSELEGLEEAWNEYVSETESQIS